MNISELNDQYISARNDWKLVRDLMQGESALKKNDLSQVNALKFQNSDAILNNQAFNRLYLPMPNIDDCSNANLLRYCQYVQRACLFNATRRTEQGMIGMVYQKESLIDMPEKISYLLSDADGSELGLMQQSSEVLADVLETGREGLLVDFPETDGAVTEAEAEEMAIRSSIIIYKAESIVDWQTKKRGAASFLSFVKLVEQNESRDENYSRICQKQFRVLVLESIYDENGVEIQSDVYIQRVYNEAGEMIGESIPKDAAGKYFEFIPFYFIGSINNRPEINPAPLLDIATVNLHHYRDSADWQESCFLVGQPTPVFAGLSEQWLKQAFAGGQIHLGSRTAIPLPVGGSASLLQASPNSMPEIGMKAKEQQMLALGARLITPSSSTETAEAAYIKHSADASVLKIIIRNINQAYSDALAAVCLFMGVSEEPVFKINDDLLASKMTGEELTSLVSAWQSGAISKHILDAKLVKGGLIAADVDLDQMNEEITQQQIGLNL